MARAVKLELAEIKQSATVALCRKLGYEAWSSLPASRGMTSGYYFGCNEKKACLKSSTASTLDRRDPLRPIRRATDGCELDEGQAQREGEERNDDDQLVSPPQVITALNLNKTYRR